MRPAPPEDAGFTMIEVLIALSLFSLTSILAVALMSQLMRTQQSSSLLQHRTEAVSRMQDFLHEALSQTMTPKSAAAEPFIGEAKRLAATIRLPPGVGSGGLTRMVLQVEVRNAALDLTIALTPVRLAAAPDRDETKGILLSGMRDIRFAYFAAGHGWSDQAIDGNEGPALIRVSLDTGDPRHAWPDLVVRPMIDSGIECRFDPILAACREAQ